MSSNKTILGDYKVGKTIGEGAFSKVKIATHTETGTKVAIKIIDKKLMAERAAKSKKAEQEREKKAKYRETLLVQENENPSEFTKLIQGIAETAKTHHKSPDVPVEKGIVADLQVFLVNS